MAVWPTISWRPVPTRRILTSRSSIILTRQWANTARAAWVKSAWPALLLPLLMLAARFGPDLLEGGGSKYWMVTVFGPLLCCFLLVIWWLTASRATWRERVFGFLGLVAGAAITIALAHPTMRGPATTYFTLPMGFFLFALTAAVLKKSPPAIRSGTAVLLAFAGFSVSILLRNDGMTGDYKFSFHPRWKKTAEETMLAAAKPTPSKTETRLDQTALAKSLVNPEWSEFRGPDRASRSLAPKISTNWTTRPPQQLWKIPVGPAWSSFTVAGRMLFTQEQRGPKEAVVCYDADSGKEIWKTEIDARLEDPMGGPGPRATPTLANAALYVSGSTGALLRLDPLTGAIVWKKDRTQITGNKTPMWGFSDSPLLVGQTVIVSGGGGEKGILAFDTTSGDLRWSAPCPGDSYGSPQLNRILDEDSVVMLTKSGLILLAKTQALEFAKNGITVNAICPGPVHTVMNDRRVEYDARRRGVSFAEQEKSMTLMGRRIEPDEVAPLAVYLAGSGSPPACRTSASCSSRIRRPAGTKARCHASMSPRKRVYTSLRSKRRAFPPVVSRVRSDLTMPG